MFLKLPILLPKPFLKLALAQAVKWSPQNISQLKKGFISDGDGTPCFDPWILCGQTYLREEPGPVPPDLPEVEDLGPEADDERGAGQHDGVVRRHQADRPLRAQRLELNGKLSRIKNYVQGDTSH